MTTSIDMKELLEAGAHFGHKTSRWHPKMAPYIHSKRNGVHIIDLSKTAECMTEALSFLSATAESGKQIMLVATKRQAADIIKRVAEATKQPYVTERWLGGMLTNWNTIGDRVKHLKDLEARMASGELANRYSKLEVQRYQEEIDDLNHLYGGVKELNGRPGAIFIVDIVKELNAVKEARRINIPSVAIVDSNADPTLITYPIPANDDAIKTIEYIASHVQAAIERGLNKRKSNEDKPEAKDK